MDLPELGQRLRELVAAVPAPGRAEMLGASIRRPESTLTQERWREDARVVIPTVLLFGLLAGRWWKFAIPTAILGWPILLIADGVDSGLRFAVEAGLLAAGNVAVGVLAFQFVRWLIRSIAERA